MRILNTKNPNISLLLIPWFVPGNQSALEIGWELNQKLTNAPDDTFCCVAIENNIIKAILISYTEDDHVFVWQARSSVGFKYQMIIFYGLIQWSKAKGYNKLKASIHNKNRIKFFERRYSFRHCGNNEIERQI